MGAIAKRAGGSSETSRIEYDLRVNLAVAYRLCAKYGWDDALATHISVRLPGPDHHFLINPYGLLFEEVTASSLVKIDLDGNPVEETPYDVNPAGFLIHSAIHRAREDAKCIIHLHTVSGVAISAQKQGLLPISPYAMFLQGLLGYHDFEGVTLNFDEQPRIVAALGQGVALILRNHGTLTIGETIPEAFQRMYLLERACTIQLAALSSGADLVIPNEVIVNNMWRQFRSGFGDSADRTWVALARSLGDDPSYRG
jgi:ribulose-5-phosphate 4-epimerase/fuculose-1-phosphate aldolase